MIGKTLAHYRVVAKLGAGGMGEVYLAEDTELRRRVAIKLISPRLAADPATLSRFKQEAQAVAALNHQNIVTIHSVEQADGLQFMTMEHVEGETLADRIRQGPLPLAEVLDIAVPVFDAIGAAHRQGIAHRDLKPGNIMLTKDGRVKVLDFGLAKLVDERAAPEETWAVTTPLTEEGTVFGTAAYMSPEQVEGKPVDARSDIFSLGIILYEMVTGRRPFGGDSRAALASSILRDDPPSVSEHNDALPRHFSRIVKLCLVKDPAERFQTASDVRIQLQELKTETGAGSRSEPPPAPAAPPHRFRAALWLVPVVLVAAVTYFATRNPSPPEAPAPAAVAPDESIFVVAVTPFWGDTEEAIAEGKVMQTLVERQMHQQLGSEKDVRILGKEITAVPRSHAEAETVGQALGATAVIWGEVLVLRDDVDIQPYITMIGSDPFGPLPPYQLDRSAPDREKSEGTEIRLDAPDQLRARKATAEEVGDLALLLAARYLDDRDPERALALLRRIQPPTSTSVLAEARILLWEQTRIDEAEDRYRQAIALDSTSAHAHDGLGDLLRRKRDFEASVREYRLAMSLAPAWDEPHAGLSHTYRALGDDRAAAAELRRAIELDPDEAGHHHFLGHVLADLDDFDGSVGAFTRAIEIAPGSSRHHICLGGEYSGQGRFEDALKAFDAALAVDPDAPDAYAASGLALGRLGRYDEAIAAHERSAALEIRDNNQGVQEHHLAAVTYLCAGRFTEALVECERALVIAAESSALRDWGSVRRNEAVTLLHLGRESEARERAALSTKDLDDDDLTGTALLRFFAAEISEDSVWAATAADTTEAAENRSEAHYYLGVAHLFGFHGAEPTVPDTTKAVEYFEECMEPGLVGQNTYHLAKTELVRLGRR